MALSLASESKYPSNLLAYALYQCAGQAGMEVSAIGVLQQQKATEREQKALARIKELQKKIAETKS